MTCPNCKGFTKNEYTCSVCGFVIKERLVKKKGIRRKSDKQKLVTENDIRFYKEIWDERPHICEVSGECLGIFDPSNFSHVLSKAAYPKFRYYKKNIVLCTGEWHSRYEFGARKERELQWVNLLKELLKEEYYNQRL